MTHAYVRYMQTNPLLVDFQGINRPIIVNQYDWYGAMRLDAADFLVGGASAATSLSIQVEGEIGVSG